LRKEGHIAEAIAHFREALASRPHYSEAHSNLGNALFQIGQENEAIVQYRAALEDDPNLAGPRNNLAVVLMQQGKSKEAVAQYRAAMTINPRDPSFPTNLAWLLATNSDPSVRNGAEAVSLAERALALTPVENATTLDSLAAAYAEAGQFDEAVATARRARDLAATEGNKSLARSIETRIDLYVQHDAYRDVTGTGTQP
jgi:Flp pilus assembly protein TadD